MPNTLLFGSLVRRGLIGCITTQQGKIIIGATKQYGVPTTLFSSMGACREKEIVNGKNLKKYYPTKNIVTGLEPIHINEDVLISPKYLAQEQNLKVCTREGLDVIHADHQLKGREMYFYRYVLYTTERKAGCGLNLQLIDPRECTY